MSRRTFRRVTFPLKLLKQRRISLDICLYFKKSLENDEFPNCLKLANIIPVFKKGARTSKNNFYRPVSILPVLSKIFEKFLSRQPSEFFDNMLLKFQYGFRKCYETQHYLLLMLDIWK